jgi:hypothetical protein
VVRAARVAAPVALISLLGSGVAAAFWPRAEYTAAVPAPVVTSAAPSVTTTSPSSPTSSRPARDETARPAAASFAQKRSDRAREKPPTLQPFKTRTPSASASAASKAVSTSDSLKVTGIRYTTTSLNVRRAPSVDAQSITVLAAGSKVSVTTGSVSGWTAILRNQQRSWVRSAYLTTTRPKPSARSSSSSARSSSSSSSGISSAPCKSSSRVESGLTPDAIRVYRALCARYPQVTTFYGVRAGDPGEHGSGRALDCMISNSTVGWDMARWVRANARRLGVSEVIYSQRIWTVQRSSEGWRPMSDRGSPTANHYDHVHVTVYGNSGSG